MMKTILLTGSAGRVAQGMIPSLRRHYRLRLLDLKRPPACDGNRWIEGSMLEHAVLDRAVSGVDGVIHCAVARGNPTARQIDVNLKGHYLLLEASARHGVPRFVHVSSTATVIGHWHNGDNVTVNSPYTTRGRYSMCKALQEQMCAHMARNSPLRIVALRPWHPCGGLTKDDGREEHREYAPGLIDFADFAEACRLGLEQDLPGRFEIFHTVATREARQRFDAARTEAILGFRAKEDFSSLLDEV